MPRCLHVEFHGRRVSSGCRRGWCEAAPGVPVDTLYDMLRTVHATRYVTPLREGGSLPAIMEADDDGQYVVKFRGAGNGPKVLVAEIVVGELARALGLPVPDLVLIDVDAALGRAEADSEIQSLVVGSEGVNVALDYLPGSVTYDAASGDAAGAVLSAKVVWLDSLTLNIDRMSHNPNLLMWHGEPWLIDHGAALYVHANWRGAEGAALQPFDMIERHVLLHEASSIATADELLAPRVDDALLTHVLSMVPDTLLEADVLGRPAAEVRTAYVSWLLQRLDAREAWVERAEAARAAVRRAVA